jgi:uncharacterized protein YoxC
MALTISIIVIAASLVVAVLIQVSTLLQIRRAAREVAKVLETARMQFAPLSHDLTVISQQINGILQSFHRQVDKADEAVATVRDAAVRLREFEEEVLQKIEEPLLEIATLFGAVGRGVGAFVRMIRR